jgi:prophage DNA circulation protein
VSWIDNLRQASFRGVEFFVDDHDNEIGRRLVIHEYPQRDKPQVDDMGRVARRYNIEAFVLGSDYMSARDDLMDACEQEGSGTLVHPYLGSLDVRLINCRVRESRKEGGWAKFSLGFVEAGERLYPSDDSDTGDAEDTADEMLYAFMEAFEEVYDGDLPDWTTNAFLSDLASAFGYMSTVISVIPDASGINAISDFLATVDAAATTVADVIGDGQDLAQQVALALAGLTSTDSSTSSTVAAAEEISRWGTGDTAYTVAGMDTIPLTTDTRRAQAANRQALIALVDRLAITHGVKAALTMPLESYDQARALAGSLMDRLEELLLVAGDSGDDAGFQALSTLRAQTLPALQNRAAKLPRLRTLLAPPGPAPALVIAHDLYGDCDRADEIVARNGIRHPLFPPSGQDLEVLIA